MVFNPRTPTVAVAAANTARDGSGTLVELYECPVDGVRVQKINWRAAPSSVEANAAMVGSVFLTDTDGLNPRLIESVAIAAVTASNTAISAHYTIGFGIDGLYMEEGQKLMVCQSVWADQGDTMHVHAILGEFGGA